MAENNGKIATGILTSKLFVIEYFRKLNIVVCRFVHIFMPIKREAGEIPARSRRCDGRLFRLLPLGDWEGMKS